MACTVQRALFLVMSACHTIHGAKDSQHEHASGASTAARMGGFRYETISQAEAPPSPTLHPQWLPQEDATRSFLNDSWLEWPPWNLTENEWLEWDANERGVSLFWVGCMIPVPVILALLYVAYLYVSRLRREHSTWRYPGVLCRFWYTVTSTKRYTCCKNNNRDGYCDNLCVEEAQGSDFYQLSNEGTRTSSTDIEAAYSMDSGVQLPHVKLLRDINNTNTDCTVQYQNLQSDDDSPS